MIQLHKGLIITILFMIGLAGCTKKEQSSNNFADADGYNTADSIISAISDERDWNKFLAACDSFEQAGDISKAKSIFYKTVAHNLLGHHRQSLGLYNQLADIDVKELETNRKAVEAMKVLIRAQMLEVRRAEKDVEAARRRLQEAMQERKIHEKLREHAFEEFKQELEYEENKAVDELVSYSYGTK